MSRYNSASYASLGFQRECIYGTRWYEALITQKGTLNVVEDEIPFEDDPDWLTLPISRREVGLQRRAVMLDYEKHAAPGDVEAHEAARQMNITAGQFYRLRRQWQQERSIFSLMPYGRPRAKRASKLSQPVSEAVSRLVNDAIQRGKLRTPGEILRRISAGWLLDEPIPSHMTLRKSISQALLESDAAAMTTSAHGLLDADDLSEPPSAYGEVIAVDHAATGIFISQEIGPIQAMITFAIDLYSSQICGFQVFAGEPSPSAVLDVLRNCAVTSRENAATETEHLHPHLYITGSRDKVWSRFLTFLGENGNPVTLRSSGNTDYTRVVHRLIGSSIGNAALIRVGTKGSRITFDPSSCPVMRLGELTALLTDWVKYFNDDRPLPRNEYRQLAFGTLL